MPSTEGLDTFGSEHGPTARGAVDIRGESCVSCMSCSQLYGALLLLYAEVSPNVLAELLDGAMRAVHEARNSLRVFIRIAHRALTRAIADSQH